MPARLWPVRSCVTSEMALQPIAGQLQQLWRGREIPICVNRVDVAEIGRQDRQSRAWIIAVAIGVKDGVDRKAVSKIVQSRPACRRTWLDAGTTNKPLERVLPRSYRAASCPLARGTRQGRSATGEDDRRGRDRRQGRRSYSDVMATREICRTFHCGS